MMNLVVKVTALAVAFLSCLVPLASTQLVGSLPACVQTCINQSGDNNCEVSDTKCLCRSSNGNFLPDLITCTHWDCDDNMDTNLLLTALQYACIQVGAPIATAAILNAEQEASSLATVAQATVTVTESAGSTAGPAVEFTTFTTTSTTTTVNSGGSTYIIVYPETYTQTVYITTASTTTAPGHSVTAVVPVIIIETDSAGSVYTSTTHELGSVSTITKTYPAGSIQTVISTYTQSASSAEPVQTRTITSSTGKTYTTTHIASGSGTGGAGTSSSRNGDMISDSSSTTTLTTSVAAQSTTGSVSNNAPGASTTETPVDPNETNGSPFAMQSAATGLYREWSWLRLAVLFFLVLVALFYSG